MSDAAAIAASAAAPKKPRQGRSPAFPFISLGKAIEKAEALRVAEGGRPKHFSPRAAIAKAWDMGEKTGPTKQTIAALGYFGLFEFQGASEDRGARLTETALHILLDKQPVSPERDALIQKVALIPAIHRELWTKWKAELPSDPTLETFLVRDKGFSEDGAKDLIEEYKATLAFAKLTGPSTIPVDKPVDEHPTIAEVGDLVQIEVNGALAFEKPKRVRAVQEHESKLWVFVDDIEAGALMEQVEVIEKGVGSAATAASNQAPRLPLPRKDEDDAEKAGVRKSRFALAEGDVVVTFPENLSADSVEDLDAFWQVFIKKARREAGTKR
jgi:hypothetical protein